MSLLNDNEIRVNIHTGTSTRRESADMKNYNTIPERFIHFYYPGYQLTFNLMGYLGSDQNEKDTNITLNIHSYKCTNAELMELCGICLEKFNENDQISSPTCKHIFHTNCIKEWGYYNQSCPMCRTPIPYNKN
jgi:hypothetical protein